MVTDGRLAGKAVVLTGASTGIGRACALRFAAAGGRLLLADVNDRDGQSLTRELTAGGADAVFVHADVSQREDNERAIDLCIQRFGAVDVLYCNAGVNLPKRLPDSISSAAWRASAVVVATTTPLPAASPSAFTTIGAPMRSM